jgi:hypothetical protein
MSTSTVPALRAQGEIALSELAKQINDKHQAIVSAVAAMLRTTLPSALDAGDLLIMAKARVGHGQFGEWVEKYCTCSYSTVRFYMQLARQRHTVEAGRCETITEAARFVSGMLPPAETDGQSHNAGTRQNEPAASTIRPGHASRHDIMLAWQNATMEERTAFVDALGRDSVLAHVPASWRVDKVIVRPSDWKPWAAMPADCRDGGALTIPDYLRREPVALIEPTQAEPKPRRRSSVRQKQKELDRQRREFELAHPEHETVQ